MTASKPFTFIPFQEKNPIREFLRRHHTTILISLVILAVSILYNLTFNRIFILDIDEAHLIKRIMAVLTGEVPLIDFKRFTYAPGRYWLFGFFFRIFGPSLALERLIWVIFRALVNVLTYLVARHMMPRNFALIPVALSMTMACVPFKTLFPFLTVLNLFTLFGYIKTQQRKWLFITGVTAGVTLWFRQDIAGFLLIAAFFCFFFQQTSLQTLNVKPPRIRVSVSLRPVFKTFGLFFSTLLIPFLPLVVFYGIQGMAHIFVWDMFIGGPLSLISRRGKMPHHFPPIQELFQTPFNWDVLFLWTPVALFIGVFFLLSHRFMKHKQFTRHDLYVLATLIMAVLTFNQTFQYAIFERLLENAVPLYILAACILALTYSTIQKRLISRIRGQTRAAFIQGIVVALLLSAPAVFILYGLTQKNVNDRLTYKRRRQEIVHSDRGVWLVKGQLQREIRAVRRAIAKTSQRDDQIVFINTALIIYHATKKDLADYNIQINYFNQNNVKQYFLDFEPAYVAVENWALKYFRWLSPSFQQEFERNYIPIATRAGHTVFRRKQDRTMKEETRPDNFRNGRRLETSARS